MTFCPVQIREQLVAIYNQTEPQEGSTIATDISNWHKNTVLRVLSQLDLSSSMQRKRLVDELKSDHRLTRLFHLTIFGASTDRNLLELDSRLTHSILSEFECTLMHPDVREGEKATKRWLAQYAPYFNKTTLDRLPPDTLFRIINDLSDVAEDEQDENYLAIYTNLPKTYIECAKLFTIAKETTSPNFRSIWEAICKIYPENSPMRYMALASYINSSELAIREFTDILQEQELFELMPYLRYGDFSEITSNNLAALLDKATKLEYLHCSDCSQLTRLPPLQVCETLHCDFCEHLTELPELPMCKTLYCGYCNLLKELPELPSCQHLDCRKCEQLEALPHLPFCKTVDCSACWRLKSLPELPVCESLVCDYCTSLQTLPKLTFCKNLDCCGCENLQELPQLPSCQQLDCSHLLALQHLPNLPACEMLICWGCSNLEELPHLPACKRLACASCVSLKSLPELFSCLKLDCRYCKKLINLPKLPECKRLTCTGCDNLKEIPELASCLKLECGSCVLLETLPTLPKCTELYCNHCINLKNLPELSTCETLNCEGCESLERLPNLPLCQKLICSGCTQLINLPELPACETLYCPRSNLVSIPDLPRCVTLDCSSSLLLSEIGLLPVCSWIRISGCTNLATLPQEFPCCTVLYCEACSNILDLPEVPQGAQVYSESECASHLLKVDLQKLRESPKDVLLELGKDYLLADQAFPTIEYYEEGERSDAIDHGGVSRDFITRLLESLFDQTKPENKCLKVDREGFPFVLNPQDDNEADCFKTLGHILAICYKQTTALKTGPLFPPDFYRKITLLPWFVRSLDIASIEKWHAPFLAYREIPSVYELLKSDTIENVSQEALEKAYFFLDAHGTQEDECSQEQMSYAVYFSHKKNQERLRATVASTAKEDKRFQALLFITYALQRRLSEKLWTRVQRRDHCELHDRVQGKLDAKSLIQNLVLSSNNVPQAQSDITFGYLTSWIEKARLEELQNFVRAATGTISLGTKKINIQLFLRGENTLPTAHTCSFTLDLPAEYPSQAVFDKKMCDFLAYALAGSGFQTA